MAPHPLVFSPISLCRDVRAQTSHDVFLCGHLQALSYTQALSWWLMSVSGAITIRELEHLQVSPPQIMWLILNSGPGDRHRSLKRKRKKKGHYQVYEENPQRETSDRGTGRKLNG
uniref:Uncharacterized protein n=1 Tax=Knipowitschia caucasica TaxID=637954 RepID=A0AAV2K1W5_KNICA